MTPSEHAMQRVTAVVIGTSAGGVDALLAILPSLPARLRPPVFIVIHLPRERPSMLSELFAARCRVPVAEAEDKLPVQAGTVYFAPPDYHLLIDQGPSLALSTEELVHYSRPAIDVLFESAADQYGSGLLGVILTGANEDGAAGMAAVQAAGGMTVVQEPATAQAPLMTESALKRVAVDMILPLPSIATLLASLPAETP